MAPGPVETGFFGWSEISLVQSAQAKSLRPPIFGSKIFGSGSKTFGRLPNIFGSAADKAL